MNETEQCDAVAALTDLPAGVTVTEAVVCVGYIDEEGAALMVTKTLGDAQLTSYLGLLSWAQVRMVTDNNDGDDRD